MDNLEIRQKIRRNNEKIKDLMFPDTFVLNTLIADLIKDNQNLQRQCSHEFIDGSCIYCEMREEEYV